MIVRHGVRDLPKILASGGVAVTAAARTVVDLARTRSFASGLASADYVLATGAASRDDLLDELERARGGRGYRRARRVVDRADARSQSVGESLSRARMYELHLPIPDLQREFFDQAGFVGRTDFWWEYLRLVGEFDGRTKYLPDGLGSDPAEVVWQEKRREDRLRALVAGVARWTWAEAYDPKAFLTVMARAGVHPTR